MSPISFAWRDFVKLSSKESKIWSTYVCGRIMLTPFVTWGSSMLASSSFQPPPKRWHKACCVTADSKNGIIFCWWDAYCDEESWLFRHEDMSHTAQEGVFMNASPRIHHRASNYKMRSLLGVLQNVYTCEATENLGGARDYAKCGGMYRAYIVLCERILWDFAP